MASRKKQAGAHVRMGVVEAGSSEQGFRCDHCGTGQAMAMPCDIDVLVAAMKAFDKKHSKCKEPAGERCLFCGRYGHVYAACSTVTTIEQWRKCLDAGMSSLAISTSGRSGLEYPHDPSDFGRCLRMLRRFPDARIGISRLAESSPVWAALKPQWNRFEALFEEESPTGAAPKLFEELQDLIDKHEPARARGLRSRSTTPDPSGPPVGAMPSEVGQ